MKQLLRIVALLSSVWLSVSISSPSWAAELPPAAKQSVEFSRDVQPLLRGRCYSCHGPETQESGLRLDVKQRALLGGDRGRAIVVDDSAESPLIQMVAGIDENVGIMPPEGEGTPLSQDEVAILRAWIEQGAQWPDDASDAARSSDHWSFQPIVRPPLPAAANDAWVQNPIDAFVLERLRREGVAPSLRADRATLVRRLYFDLLGLPPSIEQVDAFLEDTRPDAYERLVDDVLQSVHYGERWGRHWLDLARYADSDGYEKDRPRPFAWRYREWVIHALNQDMPFDQFSIEQIAGDMLPDATIDQRMASGFHRNTLHNTEGGADPEEDRTKKTVDRINTIGTIWLGLTVGCAQCHTHKYDPITQREYYSLYAFLNSIQEKDISAPLPEEAERYAAEKAEFDEQHALLLAAVSSYQRDQAALDVPQPERSKDQRKTLADYDRSLDPELAKLHQAVDEHAKKAPKAPDAKVRAVAELSSPRETRVHLRGDFLSPGDVVSVGAPAVLPPVRARGEQPDRLDFAQWLFDPDNPLTARVTVNRIWQRYFGRGIVPTVDDFGTQGDRPTHPELLDYLACELQSNGWHLKHIHRLIVTSAVYRQSSAHRADLASIDPDNELLARQVRRRVEAEIVRDTTLAVSGLLNPAVGGPSVHPPQPAEYSGLTYANSARWTTSQGGDRYRRGLYTFFQRTSPYPMLMTFDSPDSTLCTAVRSSSNTPLQSLTLLNDIAVFECAQALGRRIIERASPGSDAAEVDKNRARCAFRLCLSREPSNDELMDLMRLVRVQRDLIGRDTDAAKQIVGVQPMPDDVSADELAVWVLAGRTLMNLDEFVTRE